MRECGRGRERRNVKEEGWTECLQKQALNRGFDALSIRHLVFAIFLSQCSVCLRSRISLSSLSRRREGGDGMTGESERKKRSGRDVK